MPIITVFGTHLRMPKLLELRLKLQTTAMRVKKLGLTRIKQTTVFFPQDALVSDEDPLGTGELVAIVHGLFDKPERTPRVRQQLAHELGVVLGRYGAKVGIRAVEVIVNPPFDPLTGFFRVG